MSGTCCLLYMMVVVRSISMYASSPLSFPIVAAMLRLGTKYQIPIIRQEAIRCLELSFPSTLEKMDAVPASDLDDREFSSIKIEDEEFMDLVTLARECNVPSILPAVFTDAHNYTTSSWCMGC